MFNIFAIQQFLISDKITYVFEVCYVFMWKCYKAIYLGD